MCGFLKLRPPRSVQVQGMCESKLSAEDAARCCSPSCSLLLPAPPQSAQDVDESELSVEEAKERKIMKLLLKVKNGTPPQRKSALRQLTGARGNLLAHDNLPSLTFFPPPCPCSQSWGRRSRGGGCASFCRRAAAAASLGCVPLGASRGAPAPACLSLPPLPLPPVPVQPLPCPALPSLPRPSRPRLPQTRRATLARVLSSTRSCRC